VLVFTATLVNVFTFYASWQRRKTKGGMYFAFAMLFIAFWTLAAGLDYAAIPLSLKVFFAKMEQLGYMGAVALFAAFALSYAGYDNWLKKPLAGLLLIGIPASNVLLAWTNEFHGWVWTDFQPNEAIENVIIFVRGPAFTWKVLSGYGLLLGAFLSLLQVAIKGTELARKQARLLLLALLALIVSNLFYLFDAFHTPGVNWSSLTFSITGIFFGVALYGSRFLDLVPIARNIIIEQMEDGVLVLDPQGELVDFNPAAQEILGLRPEDLWKPIWAGLARWPDMTRFLMASSQKTTQEITLGTNSRVFDLRTTPLADRRGQIYGRLVVFREITARKQSEEILRQSEEKFYKAFHFSPDAIQITHPEDGVILDVNEGFCSLMGYSRAEALDISTLSLNLWVDPRDRQQMVESLRQNGQIRDQEYRFRAKSGRQITGLFSAEMVMLNNEARIISIVRDISQLKLRDELIRFRLELWEASTTCEVDELMQHALDKVCALTGSEIGFCHFVEADQKTLFLQTWSTRTQGEFCRVLEKGEHHPLDQAGLWAEAFRQRKPVLHNDYLALPQRRGLPEGHAVLTRELVVPVLYDLRVVAILGVGNKATDYNTNDVELAAAAADLIWTIVSHKTAEWKLRETQSQLLEHQRELAKIEERQRMARDLHDSVNQSIHSMVLFSETLVSTLEKNNFERARQIAERLQESALQSLKETRLLLYGLQDVGGETFDLVQRLENRLSTVERRAGIRAQLIQEGSLVGCPPEWRENLYWIAVEALNNALKHARARTVQVLIRVDSPHLDLEVSDTGIGFNLDKVAFGGQGLKNLRERAELLNGSLVVESQPGQGTTVRFRGKLKDQI
jgi:PAS domain S-box-containing protein